MIWCRLETERGMIRFLESSGHGAVNSTVAGVSISCAAVSTLIRSLGVLLETSDKVVIGVEKFSPGEVRLRVEHVDESAEEWLRGLTDMLARGLEDVQKDFPDDVQYTSSKL
jgi:uncharacterized protein YsxB (DUF464 family)